LFGGWFGPESAWTCRSDQVFNRFEHCLWNLNESGFGFSIWWMSEFVWPVY
jgi:hypothetical protein